jgi:hypothetical protein
MVKLQEPSGDLLWLVRHGPHIHPVTIAWSLLTGRLSKSHKISKGHFLKEEAFSSEQQQQKCIYPL